MKVLVTGGSGVIGRQAVAALLEKGHEVRMLSRHADRDAGHWDERVEPWEGDVATPDSLAGASRGCDAVLHIAGIATENPPEMTFEKINVRGTTNMLTEAYSGGVRRFVMISSLGADRGESDYHKSKLEAENLVRGMDGNWTIVRPGNVYGPGDEVISTLLRIVRTFPAVPVIGGGDQPFQPVWCGDLGKFLVRVLERDDLGGRILEATGTEVTNLNDVIDRISRLTGRSPVKLPVPGFLAEFGVKLADILGIELPADENKLTMLRESRPLPPEENALVTEFDGPVTGVDEGLRKLIESLPEQQPSEGVGPFHEKRFFADISGSPLPAKQLFDHLRRNCTELIPITFENGSEGVAAIEEGQNLTASLPGRGQIQMRIVELTPVSMTFSTLEGHPLAGVVRFGCEENGATTRFEVLVNERAAGIADAVAMETVGGLLQDSNWVELVERMVGASRGTAVDGVQQESRTLEGEEAKAAEQRVEEMLASLHRRHQEVL